MSKMSFKPQVLWLAFLSALYLSSQIINASKFPRDKDELEQSYEYCVKDHIKEDFVPKWFQNELSYGERIEEFCKNKDASNIEEMLKKYSREDIKIGEKIRDCIHDFGFDEMYKDYYNFGVEKFNELHDRNMKEQLLNTLSSSSSKDDKDTEPESSRKTIQTKDDQTEISPPQSLLPTEDEDRQTSKDDEGKEDILNLSKFFLGMCNKDKPLKYEDLEDAKEKEITIDCLLDCTSVLITRTYKILNDRRKKIMKDLEKKGIIKEGIKSEDISESKFPDEMKYLKKESKIDQTKHSLAHAFYSSEIQDLATMRQKVKEFLDIYSEAYADQNEYLSKFNINYEPTIVVKARKKVESDDKQSKEEHLVVPQQHQQQPSFSEPTLNDLLSRYFVYCKACAKRECFMKKSSLPLYGYVYDVVNGVEDKITTTDQTIVPMPTDNEARISGTAADGNTQLTKMRMDQSQRKFFEVLVDEDRKQNDFNNDDDDDSSNNEQ